MALVSKPKGYVEPKPEEGTERKVVDVFAAGAPVGKASKINIEEDAWERIAPPPRGRYSLQLFPADNAVTVNENKKGEFESYSINIMARIVKSTEDNNDAICWPTVTTRFGRGKEISTAVGLLVKLGYDKAFKPGVEYTDLAIARAMVGALKKEPIIDNNLCDWKASYQDDKGWHNIANTMEDFPVVNGEREHIIKVTKRDGSRDELKAKFFVREWGGKGSKAETETVVVVKEPAVAFTGSDAQLLPKVVKKAPTPVVEEEEAQEEELMLEV